MLLESLPYLGGGKLLVEGSILKVQTLRNSPFFRFAQVSWSLRQHRLDPGRARKWIRTKFIIELKCVFLEKDVFFRLFTRMGVMKNLNLREEPNFRFSDSAY